MMNEKTRSFKIYLSYLLTFSLIIGFFTFPAEEVKAEGTARYVTKIITNWEEFDLNSTEYVCTTYKYKLGDQVVTIPEGSAIVTVYQKGSDAATTHKHNAEIAVDVKQKGTGFDGCSRGVMRYIENETYYLNGNSSTPVTGTGWIYACTAYWSSQHILTQPMYIYLLSDTQPVVHTFTDPELTPGTTTFTATCTCEECTDRQTYTLTLNPENTEYTGKPYDKAYNKNDLDDWTFAGIPEPTLTYYTSSDISEENKTSPTSGGAVTLGGAPKEQGTYWVVGQAGSAISVPVSFCITGVRAAQTIGIPTFSAIGSDTVILEELEAGHGETLYGISADGTEPTEWQNSVLFTGLEPETEYYFFAKYTGDMDYKPAVSAGNPATTLEYTAPAIEIPAELYVAAQEEPENKVENYTIPVSNENSVPVTAEIEEGVAAIEDITEETMDNILGKNVPTEDGEVPAEPQDKKEVDTILIDLSGAEQNVSGVKIPTQTIEKFEQVTKDDTNAIDTVTVEFTDATVVIDTKTLSTLKDAAKDDGYVKLVVEDTNEDKLLTEQKAAIETHEIERVFEAYFETEKGTRIHDFKGGTAMVYIDFTVPKGKEAIYFHVYYVSEEGSLEKYYTTVGSKRIGFKTGHFSDYVIIYDENDANANADILGYDENGNPIMKADLEGISTGRTFGRLKARAVESTENSINVEWTYVPEADGYIVYGNFCNHEGQEYKYQYITTITSNKVLSYLDTDLSAGTYYKYVVRAYKNLGGKQYVIAQSVAVHETTEGDKYTNATGVRINKVGKKQCNTTGTAYYMELAGKVVKIDAEETKEGLTRQHRDLCYESSDEKIAVVDEDGNITMVSKGTCEIWVYAQNGYYATIKLEVK